jgi:hypothetical protein
MIIYTERSAAEMDFKETRIKQIETALKTTRERFRSLAENDFKEIEDFKVQAVADAINLLDNYFESLKNDEDPEVENLRKEYNKLLESIDEHEPI